MRPATVWRQEAEAFAGCITALLAALALVLIRGTRQARRRAALTVEDRAVLAATHAQFEVARAVAAAKTEQLEATLAGMIDGVSMFDAHLCLVEWNARFPGLAGVPPDILRAGLPMEEILRAQISTGQFGPFSDPEAEVATPDGAPARRAVRNGAAAASGWPHAGTAPQPPARRRLRHALRRYHRTPADRTGPARGEGRGGDGERREVALHRHRQPRDPDPAERTAQHAGAAERQRPRPGANVAAGDGPPVRRASCWG